VRPLPPPDALRLAAQARPADARAQCKAAYDRAHAALSRASCLVFDTETSGFAGSVLNIGWVLADEAGIELAYYDALWRLPARERIDSRAFKAHGISSAQLQLEGVPAGPEVCEFMALVAAALAAKVRVVAHHTSFDVARINHTAHRHAAKGALRSADMLCTMHSATKHCGLRCRGGKRLKAPRNEELYSFLFGRQPPGRLHRALADARVTLASYVEAKVRKWW